MDKTTTASTQRIAGRNTLVEVADEDGGILRVSHNWDFKPGAHTLEMSPLEAKSGIFIEAQEKDADGDGDAMLGLAPTEARLIGNALLALADEVEARVMLDA